MGYYATVTYEVDTTHLNETTAHTILQQSTDIDINYITKQATHDHGTPTIEHLVLQTIADGHENYDILDGVRPHEWDIYGTGKYWDRTPLLTQLSKAGIAIHENGRGDGDDSVWTCIYRHGHCFRKSTDISALHDQMNTELTPLIDALTTAKSGIETNIVTVLLSGGDPLWSDCPPFDNTIGAGAIPSPALSDWLSRYSNHEAGSACAPGYEDVFLTAISTIETACDEFTPVD